MCIHTGVLSRYDLKAWGTSIIDQENLKLKYLEININKDNISKRQAQNMKVLCNNYPIGGFKGNIKQDKISLNGMTLLLCKYKNGSPSG